MGSGRVVAGGTADMAGKRLLGELDIPPCTLLQLLREAADVAAIVAGTVAADRTEDRTGVAAAVVVVDDTWPTAAFLSFERKISFLFIHPWMAILLTLWLP